MTFKSCAWIIVIWIAVTGMALVVPPTASAQALDLSTSNLASYSLPNNAPPSTAPPTSGQPQASSQLQPSSQVTLGEGDRIATGDSEHPVAYITYKTPYEYWLTGLSIAVLAVAIVSLSVMGWRTGLTPDFVRAFIVVVIVFAALFLIAAGYSDKQAAPVYALLGTIIGYIFGRLTVSDAAAAVPVPAAAPPAPPAPVNGNGAPPPPAADPAPQPAH